MALLTTEELVNELHISRAHLWRLRNGGLPSYRIGNSVRFDPVVVKGWLEANCREEGKSDE